MPSKKKVLYVRVSAEEHQAINDSAARAGISVSQYVTRVCAGHPVTGLEDKRLRLELNKVNADMGRLGGLFKLSLTMKDEHVLPLHSEIRAVLKQIEARQAELKKALASHIWS